MTVFRDGAVPVPVPVAVVSAAAAGRVLRLPLPRLPPPGPLEGVAWVLVHRVAPFDPVVQVRLATRWGLPIPRVLAERAGAAEAAGGQGLAVRRRLALLCAGCPSPPVLVEALRLLAAVPHLPHEEVRRVLAMAGLSQGEAGAVLLRALAGLWGLEVAGTALWPASAQLEDLAGLGRQVRRQGVVLAPRVLSAGDADWLAEREGVQCSDGHLVAGRDSRSGLGRAVRRQLGAVGPLPAAMLARGVARVRRDLAGTTGQAVLAWAGGQPGLQVHGSVVVPTGEARRWLLASDLPVLALSAGAAGGTGEVARPQVLAVLRGHGLTAGGASLWLVRCPWLRPSGRRGRFRPAAPA